MLGFTIIFHVCYKEGTKYTENLDANNPDDPISPNDARILEYWKESGKTPDFCTKCNPKMT